jgi:hypothetical protein
MTRSYRDCIVAGRLAQCRKQSFGLAHATTLHECTRDENPANQRLLQSSFTGRRMVGDWYPHLPPCKKQKV